LGRDGTAAREGQIGRGDRGRRTAIPQAALETLREERVGRASAIGFAATVSEPFRSGRGYGRGSRPIKPRSAKNAERLAASLRSGALTGRAHARKNLPAIFGMSLSAPVGATPPQTRRSASCQELFRNPCGLTKRRSISLTSQRRTRRMWRSVSSRSLISHLSFVPGV
jgi:hypothetical protein